MYHRILVPLDRSPRSERILPYVTDLAAHYRAEILLLHVVQPVSVTPLMTDFVPEPPIVRQAFTDEEEARDYLEMLQRRLTERELRARFFIERGDVVSGILRVARGAEADLVALASHGRSGLQRVFYGSVAAGLIAQIDRPLLLIRALDEAA